MASYLLDGHGKYGGFVVRYYEEDEMKDVRTEFEKKVLTWPDITTRKMFGCPCYKTNERLFAFLVTKGVVLTRLSEAERKKVAKKYEIGPFQAGKRTMNAWTQISVSKKGEIKDLLPIVKKSYEAARNK